MTLTKFNLSGNRSPKQCVFPVSVDDDFFRNESGFFRWKKIRLAYFKGCIDVDDVVSLYRKWRDQKECFMMDGFDVWGDYQVTAWGKASKRGNDVYKAELKKRFSVFDRLQPLNFSDIFCGKTPMLFLTLTIDSKRYGLDEAWRKVSGEFHTFLAKVQQEYGSFCILRCWEAHESGYPHIHLLIYFKKRLFVTFNHKNKLRIADKHRENFTNWWSMGENVDVQGVSDTQGAFSEVQKYVTKSVFTEKGDKTNAMVCLYKMRQFSISQHFVESIWGGLAGKNSMKNGSFSDLVRTTVRNCNEQFSKVVDFRFGGMIHGEALPKILGQDKPPPEIFDIDYNVFRIFGMLGEAEAVDDSFSGSVVLDDEDRRFQLGLMPLDVVRKSKPSLLSVWFSSKEVFYP